MGHTVEYWSHLKDDNERLRGAIKEPVELLERIAGALERIADVMEFAQREHQDDK
jgi:hypothetical protein